MTNAAVASASRTRGLSVLFWLAPVVLLLLVFGDGLNCWFLGDDFAWLGLSRQVHNNRDLLRALFEPAAQGTIRPWSERGFFLLFEAWFGFDALPYRIMAFALMAADLLLLGWLVRRMTGSPLAGCVAASVWAANTALMTVMTWSSALNEAMCPFFLLLALASFVRFLETGKLRFWWLQLAVFVLGFGALEINIVYPGIALAWVLLMVDVRQRRKAALSVIPLVIVSVAYYLLHRALAPLPATGAYALHFDSRIFETLALYAKWSLLPVDWKAFGHSGRTGTLFVTVCAVALAVLLVSELRHRRTGVLMGLAWMQATLTPVLPLPDHRTDYYLTIPVAGLGILAGWGVAVALRQTGQSAWPARILAGVALAAYFCAMIPVSRAATLWSLEKSNAVRGFVLGVDAAHHTHPGKAIMVDGVSAKLYEDSIGQGAFYALRVDAVYLTPGSEQNLHGGADLADLEKTIPDPAATFHALQRHEIVVYSIAGDHLRNITESYERSAPVRLINPSVSASRFPGRVDVGNPLYSWLLGPSWLPTEAGVRWMPGRATVRIRRPEPGNKLLIEGTVPEELLKQNPRHLTVLIDGRETGNAKIADPETTFRRLFDIVPDPAGSVEKTGSADKSTAQKDDVEIEIRVDPVSRISGQDYGVVFGRIALVPSVPSRSVNR